MSSAITHVLGNGVDISVTFSTIHHTPGKCLPNLSKYPQDPNLRSTRVNIQVNSLPSNGIQSFPYHIHEKPVADNNCTTTGGHHDPHKVKATAGPSYKCNPADFKTCELGDLSGKHGTINSTNNIFYVDRLPSTNELSHYSIVVHDNTDPTKRIACANIQLGGN